MKFINQETKEVISFMKLKEIHSNISFTATPPEDLINELGYFTVHQTDMPDGDVVTEGEPEKGDDDKYYQSWNVREYTGEEHEQMKGDVFTYKTDVWSRATDEEADQIDKSIADSPTRMRKMWDDCLVLDHSSELFELMYNHAVEMFGKERANEILKASELDGRFV